MKKKMAIGLLLVAALVMVSGLFVPRSNPAVENEVTWDSAETRTRFMQSCADCHSHETVWPWYARVGPSAFLVFHNVSEGREHFNISIRDMGEADEAGEEVLKGAMPPRDYLLLHPGAALDDAGRKAFARGLDRTFGGEFHGGDARGHHDRD